MEREILQLLHENAKLTPKQIATMLGVTEKEVRAKIKELEERKAIIKYHTLINWEKTDYEPVMALIEVKVTPQREVGFDGIARRIYQFAEVKDVYLMSGDYDLAVMVEGSSMKEVALFVALKLSTIEGVQSCATHFILKTYKHEGVILDDEEEDRRLVITP
ncbi:Lrp/AsnC family transcriptional regulator [Carboxydothermus ferrireducens]|uniref:DNA-binding Lrp family transcriptional regulator n=1 Tax=Carboxydothermus ferrireducens DSM 11255 TaxID=1119529 RepID=A0ABX2R8G8_9THEO|nr:Lrp/AsnC family transcriptional regulator [Carboxydothermus ferrireducens]NYE57468.1 DNA-binding Lrp family transcriptional regulator [Carboxydothermus ferrireducens DSM 11255]